MTDPTTEEDFIELGNTIKKLPNEEQEKELDNWKKYFRKQCTSESNCKCGFAYHLYPTLQYIDPEHVLYLHCHLIFNGILAGNEMQRLTSNYLNK